MAEARRPNLYSIAAHRGFADALVAGLGPRYQQGELGLANLTLIVPSSRAAKTISEAFIRDMGEGAAAGMLMPRMVTVGDLDLDESLGALLDPLGASDIPPAIDPTRRWLELARLVEVERKAQGDAVLPGAALLRMARDLARTMDRLLIEGKTPEDLVSEPVLEMLDDLSGHWQKSLRLFAAVQARWRSRLEELGAVDAATRRNMLFDRAARQWRKDAPDAPIVAAGVTSASPSLARMLRTIADLPNGAVILPDLDLIMSDEAWEELGGVSSKGGDAAATFGADDALTHPQYHLKLLLDRMGVAREEVMPWHRRGMTASEPARSHAISTLFLPPRASRTWVTLGPEKRRLSGVRILKSATSEEEAQAIALLVREALEQPEKRIAVITADRSLARRVTQHLQRWQIQADDSAGKPLALTPSGRLFGLVADLVAAGPQPAGLIGLLAHPLIHAADKEARRLWLSSLRKFDRALRGPRPASGIAPLRAIAAKAGVAEWWNDVEAIVSPLLDLPDPAGLADQLDLALTAAEALAGDNLWAREDGRALSLLLEDIRSEARSLGTQISPSDLGLVMRDTLNEVAVRPPYGGHPRVSIYGLLESRMARADLVICGGLTEGSWPQTPSSEALLAPGVLRALGVPGAEFRIGLAAHDLAGAMGAPEVVLSRALRDAEGPVLPSRFLLRAEALLGALGANHREERIPALAARIDRSSAPAQPYERPAPRPSAEQRKVDIKVTALDRLLGDPYQFYAREILGLRKLDTLAADPFNDPALRGTLVHDILDAWHKAQVAQPDLGIVDFATEKFAQLEVHPLFRGLWQPRILGALERFEEWVNEALEQGREVIATESNGSMTVQGVVVRGRADRIDRLPDGRLVLVDYKTGKPPSAAQVEHGYALQMGLLGLIGEHGAFEAGEDLITATAGGFEYWSLAKKDGEFGYVDQPMKVGAKRSGLTPDEFLPKHEEFLARAIAHYILGDHPFTAKLNPDYPGYSDYDQLMRLDEWIVRLNENAGKGEA